MASISQLLTMARQRINAIGDSFWSDAELYDAIYQAQMDLALETRCIQQVYTSTTVASTQQYSKPTNTITIKRVEYNGYKLEPITMREDDAITLSNAATTSTGVPEYYFEWGDSIYLRPIPSDANTLKIYSINMPQAVSATSTLEVPTRYHLDILHYMIYVMLAKDEQVAQAANYYALWEKAKFRAKKFERVRLRNDSSTHMQDPELLPTTIIGTI